MQLVFLGIIVSLLSLLVFQDLKYRSVHWLLLPMLFVSITFFRFPQGLQVIVFNGLFVVTLLFFLTLYVSLRNKKLTNLTRDYFGWGDILFLLAIIPVADNFEFMLLVISGTLFTLILTLVISRFRQIGTVPYAGFFALFLLAYIPLNYFLILPNFNSFLIG